MSEWTFLDADWVLGPVRMVAFGEKLTRLEFVGQQHALEPAKHWRKLTSSGALFGEVRRQLDAFAQGRLKVFDLPLHLDGTAFQQAVWREIAGIRFGDLLTYGEIAKRIGSPEASRAVGAATGRNPISVVVPCHRVVGSARQLTGYAGGLPRKVAMLKMELGAIASLASNAHANKENQMPATTSIDQLRPGLL